MKIDPTCLDDKLNVVLVAAMVAIVFAFSIDTGFAGIEAQGSTALMSLAIAAAGTPLSSTR